MSILPPEVRAGYVYDRVLRAIGDRPYDEDRLPDGIPAQGRVIFRPKTSVKQIVSDGRGVTVTREPVTCTIHRGEDQPDDPDASKGGLLIDEAGAVGGVWLVVGGWSVEYHMEDRYSNIPNEEIIVTKDHTEENPLDIALASELTPTPTQKFVVNEQIYLDSKNYRNEALEFRNDAQEAFEKFSWPVQVQDTPPENTDVIWVNPDEPAGTASDWALRAEAAAVSTPHTYVSDVKPESPKLGDIWFDTSEGA